MSNPTSPIDFSMPLATFLSQIVSDGTYGDIIQVPKMDETGRTAAASRIRESAGQLWANLMDDMFKAMWDRQFLARKVWGVADAASREALGSGDGLSVGDLAFDGIGSFHRAVSVTATSSTWALLDLAGAPGATSGRSVVLDYDLSEFGPFDLLPLGDGPRTITDGSRPLSVHLFNTESATAFSIGPSGLEIQPAQSGTAREGPGVLFTFPSLLGADWLGRPMIIEMALAIELEELSERSCAVGIGTPQLATAGAGIDSSLLAGAFPSATASGLIYRIGGRTGADDIRQDGPSGRVPFRGALRLDVAAGGGAVTLWDAVALPDAAAQWELLGTLPFPMAGSSPRGFALVPSEASVNEGALGVVAQISATTTGVRRTNALRIRRLRVTA